MLLDTTFLIDLLDQLDAAEDALADLIEGETPVAVSPLTVYETGIGLRESEYARFDEILASMVVLPPGRTESRRALSIQRRLDGQGEPIGDIDSLIAATAVESADSRVLTRNVEEFARVADLDVETY
ncbi:type II toxin-antitoxin system VapC family toxin [Halococcus saccharolyticus]|uniref:Ribonuclease VapC n=1 Tax=Halococcus saccharolyticus DSM 5350 TaxID=1227455 RepID=M0MMT5_9EURY|nr:PIN domain-containing protein [Halococcus saccharolyticus]EMA46688.1 PilT protein domain protein [Halococcus saccharolyticus DSM 5350]